MNYDEVTRGSTFSPEFAPSVAAAGGGWVADTTISVTDFGVKLREVVTGFARVVVTTLRVYAMAGAMSASRRRMVLRRGAFCHGRICFAAGSLSVVLRE